MKVREEIQQAGAVACGVLIACVILAAMLVSGVVTHGAAVEVYPQGDTWVVQSFAVLVAFAVGAGITLAIALGIEWLAARDEKRRKGAGGGRG